MTIDELLDDGAPPVIAILRGVQSGEAVEIAAALIAVGIRMIEVPLNSPEPFASIAALQETFGDGALLGAGTVLDCAAVDRLAETGAGLLVAPNTDPEVIAHGIARGLEVMPGFLTPSEAFAAIAAGARKLKLFPAIAHGAAYTTALSEVLPPDVAVWAVGGVDAGNIADWLSAGAEGVAVGGGIYRAGWSADEVGRRAKAIMAAIKG